MILEHREAVSDRWQTHLDYCAETGLPPIFDVGSSATAMGGMPGVQALHQVAVDRADVLWPTVMMGGTGPLWLVALFHERPRTTPVKSPGVEVIYTAPDAATHLAAMSTVDEQRTSAFRKRPADLPPAIHWAYAPTSCPGAPVNWDSLPMTNFEPPVLGHGWLAWAGVAVALSALLIAFID